MKSLVLDLDGVLANFAQTAIAHHGATLRYKDIRWNFPGQIGFEGAEDPRFWEPLGFDFWRNLPVHEDGMELLRRVQSSVDIKHLAILTSPAGNPGALEGKRAWVEDRLPHLARATFYGKEKWRWAKGNLLIDDHDNNIAGWEEHGGSGVLFPRPWNERREDVHPFSGKVPVDHVFREVITKWEAL